jgi:hypothetical protein
MENQNAPKKVQKGGTRNDDRAKKESCPEE